MSHTDIAIMTRAGYPEADAITINDLAAVVQEETLAFGLHELHIIRALRAAYDLGRIPTPSRKSLPSKVNNG